MSAGDYRKPGVRPENKPLYPEFGENPAQDAHDLEWFSWVMYEVGVRMGVVSRTGEAKVYSDSDPRINTEELLDDFFDEFDRLVLHEQHNS